MRLTHNQLGNVAIVGGGYAGLMCGWNICNKAQQLHVYDVCNVGEGGASAASGGLMHPLSPRGKFITDGLEGFKRSLSVMESLRSKQAFFKKDVKLQRPVLADKELKMWSQSASKLPEWIDISKSADQIPMVAIKNAVVVDSRKYLNALWDNICFQHPKAEWRKTLVTDLSALSKQYDQVLLTSGVGSSELWHKSLEDKSQQLAVRLVRGQNLYYDIPNTKLEDGIFREQYILPVVDQSSAAPGSTRVVCGANHEYLKTYDHVRDNQPHLPRIEADIHENLCKLLPAIASLKPVHCNAGVRLVGSRKPEGRLPMIGRHPDLSNVWMLAAFGSRGLLYHALAADILCRAIAEGDESVIPEKYRVRYLKNED